MPYNPTGAFCYGFWLCFDPTKGGYQHPPGLDGERWSGHGEKYRITAGGLAWRRTSRRSCRASIRSTPESDDVAWQASQSAVLLGYGDKLCRAGL